MDKRYEQLKVEFGSLYRLAKILKVTPNAVYNWKTLKTIPLKHVRTIETMTEGRITRKDLRPDIFGDII